MATEARSARDLTRSLTARAIGKDKPVQGDALAVLSACERAFGALSRSLGAPGFGTLLRRAKATAEAMHPLMSELHLASHEPYLGGIPELVQLHGDPAVIKGLEVLMHLGSAPRAQLSERAGLPVPAVKLILQRLEFLGYAMSDDAGNWTPLAMTGR